MGERWSGELFKFGLTDGLKHKSVISARPVVFDIVIKIIIVAIICSFNS